MRNNERAIVWWVLVFLLGYGEAYAHDGVHSSTDLSFDQQEGIPLVTSNWGFFQHSSNSWQWVCPEAIETLDLYRLAGDGQGWWIGTLDGLWFTADQCEFSILHFAGEYVREVQVFGQQIWVATATGFLDNALWYSSDGGEHFDQMASFGAGSRIFGMHVWENRVWTLTERDDVFSMWVPQREYFWTELRIPEDMDGWIDLLHVDSEENIWIASTGERMVLWQSTARGTWVERVETPGRILVLEQIEDWIIVGGDWGFVVSSDLGETWSDPIERPEVACAEVYQDELYICSHNWLDGAAVLKTTAQGDPTDWTWTPVFSFSEVTSVKECPLSSRTHQACDPLWEAGLLNAGFSEPQMPAPVAEPDCSGCEHSSSTSILLFGGVWIFFPLARRQN